jgi:hypothetical protein
VTQTGLREAGPTTEKEILKSNRQNKDKRPYEAPFIWKRDWKRAVAKMSQKTTKNTPGRGKGAPKGKKGAVGGKKSEDEREETLQAVV